MSLAPGYLALALLLLAVGVAAFHAPAMIASVSGPRVGAGMSIFMASGELGRTVGPAIVVAGSPDGVSTGPGCQNALPPDILADGIHGCSCHVGTTNEFLCGTNVRTFLTCGEPTVYGHDEPLVTYASLPAQVNPKVRTSHRSYTGYRKG